jgi:Domain of unknown function (DUF1844)
MAENKQNAGFTVSDRRLFTEEGELRKDLPEEAPTPPPPAPKVDETQSSATLIPQAAEAPEAPAPEGGERIPPPPTDAEQQAQADAYKQSSKDMDRRVELSGHSSRDLQMSFERFLASLYMSAMLQLGLMHEEGAQPRVDLIGARQSIDTLGLLQEKTKGNLTAAESNFLQNCLYELRMAYVEVMNALARPPQAQDPAAGTGKR